MDEQFKNKCSSTAKTIADNAVSANQAYAIFKQLWNLGSTEIDIFNISPVFYGSVINNCIQVLIIEINKMFDPDPKSIGVYGLLNKMKSGINQLKSKESEETIETVEFLKFWDNTGYCITFSNLEELIEESLEEIASNKGIIDKIKVLRDQYYAHFDSRIKDYDELFSETAITYSNLEQLLLLNINLCNRLYYFFYE